MKPLRTLALLCALAGPARAGGVGWTPGTAATAPAPAVVAVRTGTGLQAICDALTAGGVIELGEGRFYADPSDTTIGLTLSQPIAIVGTGGTTVVASPILIAAPACRLESMTITPPGGAYGVKLYRAAGGGVSRCTLRDLFIGAADTTGRNAGLGPVKGLYLDGAILTEIDHCTFAFCSGSGVYLNTTNGTYSTNANKFYSCTSNLNGRYGYEFQGGSMEGNEVQGGNVESNKFGAIYATTCNNLTLRGMDFESGVYVNAQLLDINASNPVLVEDCHFVTTVGDTRAFLFSTCAGVSVAGCRFSGFPVQAATGIFNEASNNCREWANSFNDSAAFIMNRGGQKETRFALPTQPRLSDFTGLMWLPSQTGAGETGLGDWDAGAGAISQATPTGTNPSTELRRTIFTTTGGSTTCGVASTGTGNYQFWKGNFAGAGGFYFSATFRLETWAGNTAGLFVGLASSAAGHVCTATSDSTTIAGDVIGLYHSPGDVVNVLRVVARNNVTTQKPTLTASNGGPTLATGQGFRFEMWNFPYSTRTICRLTSLNTGLLVGYAEATTNGPRTTAFLAPQCEIENNLAGPCALGVANVYVSR